MGEAQKQTFFSVFVVTLQPNKINYMSMSSLLQPIIPSDSITLHTPTQPTFGELIKAGEFEQVLDNALTWGID